jgi:hypothetical protein
MKKAFNWKRDDVLVTSWNNVLGLVNKEVEDSAKYYLKQMLKQPNKRSIDLHTTLVKVTLILI